MSLKDRLVSPLQKLGRPLWSQVQYPTNLPIFSFWGICSQIGFTVLLLLFFCITLELGTRLTIGAPIETEMITLKNVAYAFHPWSGNRMTPGFQYQNMVINSYGWRGKEYPEEKPPGVKRVILLGDSVAFSSFTINDEATIAGYLEKILIEKTGHPWEVINMAIPSGTGHKSLGTLAHEGIHFEPDFVVALNGANDVAELAIDRSVQPTLFTHVQWTRIDLVLQQLFDPRTSRGVPAQNLSILFNESAFFRWFSRNDTPNKRIWPSVIDHPERLDQFIKSQIAIYYLARGSNAKFIHFIQPYLSIKHKKLGPNEIQAISNTEELYGKGYFEFLDAAFPILRAKMQQAANQHGFHSIDLSQLFIEEEVFSDQVHFVSTSSSENVANQKIATRMAEEILLESNRKPNNSAH